MSLKKPVVKEDIQKADQASNNVLVDDLFGNTQPIKPIQPIQPAQSIQNNDPWGFVNVEAKPKPTQTAPINQFPDFFAQTNLPTNNVAQVPQNKLQGLDTNELLKSMYSKPQPQNNMGSYTNKQQTNNNPSFNFPNQGYGMNAPDGMNQPNFGMNQQGNFGHPQQNGMNQMNNQFNQMNMNKNTPQFSQEYINSFNSINAKKNVSTKISNYVFDV
jgi:hypothetical protein